MRVLLEARALSIGYAGRSLGSGLDLQLQAGEVLALLGANGSGKTTFLKTLLGLLPPLAGEVRLCGRSLAALPARERARLLAYVPQAAGQGFAFSVLDMVLMGRAAHLDVLARPVATTAKLRCRFCNNWALSHWRSSPGCSLAVASSSWCCWRGR